MYEEESFVMREEKEREFGTGQKVVDQNVDQNVDVVEKSFLVKDHRVYKVGIRNESNLKVLKYAGVFVNPDAVTNYENQLKGVMEDGDFIVLEEIAVTGRAFAAVWFGAEVKI